MNTKRNIIGILVALAIGVAAASPSFAAKGTQHPHTKPGGGSGTSSVSLVVLTSPGDGLPHYRYSVTFNVATTATDQPWVNLKCYQNGVFVAGWWGAFFDGALNGNVYTLDGGLWTGGAANCTAWLETPSGTNLASVSFLAYA